LNTTDNFKVFKDIFFRATNNSIDVAEKFYKAGVLRISHLYAIKGLNEDYEPYSIKTLLLTLLVQDVQNEKVYKKFRASWRKMQTHLFVPPKNKGQWYIRDS